MGYRSDVRIVIRGPKELILREWANLRLTGSGVMGSALDEWKVIDDNPISFAPDPNGPTETIECATAILGQGGTDWKWYPYYEDVQAHETIWEHFRDLFDNASGEADEGFLDGAFIRVGEEDDDIETRYFGDSAWDLARVTRSIYSEYDDMVRPDIRPRLAPAEA